MGFWESRYIWTNVGLEARLVFYGHYIDDLLTVWDRDENSLTQAMDDFNNNDLGFKFTHQSHSIEIVFLDVALSVNVNNIIQTKVHFK
ncbi:hypothetical protein FKM82_017279 [Ascaphus truei]